MTGAGRAWRVTNDPPGIAGPGGVALIVQAPDLSRTKQLDVARTVAAGMRGALTASQQKILHVFRDGHRPQSERELCNLTGLSRSTVRGALIRLLTTEHLVGVGPTERMSVAKLRPAEQEEEADRV